MQFRIDTPLELGRLLRAVRQSQGLRQDDLASMIGASHVFLGDVERGKGTVQLGRVLAALSELGITVHLNVPPEAAALAEAVMRK